MCDVIRKYEILPWGPIVVIVVFLLIFGSFR